MLENNRFFVLENNRFSVLENNRFSVLENNRCPHEQRINAFRLQVSLLPAGFFRVLSILNCAPIH